MSAAASTKSPKKDPRLRQPSPVTQQQGAPPIKPQRIINVDEEAHLMYKKAWEEMKKKEQEQRQRSSSTDRSSGHKRKVKQTSHSTPPSDDSDSDDEDPEKEKQEKEKKRQEDALKGLDKDAITMEFMKKLINTQGNQFSNNIPAQMNITEFGSDDKVLAIQWIKKFEERCDAFNVSPTKVISVFLTGEGIHWHRNLSEAKKNNWSKMKKSFLKEFSLTNCELKQKIKESYKKQKDESIQKFANRLVDNQELLMATGETPNQEELRDNFIAGLRMEPGRLGDIFQIMFNRYQGTFKEALKKAKLAEEDYNNKLPADDKAAKPSSSQSSSYVPSPIKMLSEQVRLIADQQTKMMTEAQENLVKIMNQTSSGLMVNQISSSNQASNQNNNQPNSANAQNQGNNDVLGRADGKRKPTCYYCGDIGHIKPKCSKMSRDKQDHAMGRQACNEWKAYRTSRRAQQQQSQSQLPPLPPGGPVSAPMPMQAPMQTPMPMPMHFPYPMYQPQYHMMPSAAPIAMAAPQRQVAIANTAGNDLKGAGGPLAMNSNQAQHS
jgi:hypothetical protein